MHQQYYLPETKITVRYNIMVQNTQTDLDLMYPGFTNDCVSLFVP